MEMRKMEIEIKVFEFTVGKIRHEKQSNELFDQRRSSRLLLVVSLSIMLWTR